MRSPPFDHYIQLNPFLFFPGSADISHQTADSQISGMTSSPPTRSSSLPPDPPPHLTPDKNEKTLLSIPTADADANPPNSYLLLHHQPEPLNLSRTQTSIILTILFTIQIALLCTAESIASLATTPSRPGMWTHGRKWRVGSKLWYQCEWVGCEPVVLAGLVGRERVMFW